MHDARMLQLGLHVNPCALGYNLSFAFVAYYELSTLDTRLF